MTRSVLLILLCACLILLACGKRGSIDSIARSSYRRSELQTLAAIHLQGMDTYDGTIVWNDGNPSYPRNQGNGNLFEGLLCYSGELPFCDRVIRLRCANGHLTRSPWMACGDESRDEYLGQALTSLKTLSVFTLPSTFPFMVTPIWARSMALAGYKINSVGGAVDHAALLTEIKTAPLGYKTHLGALEAWIRRERGEHSQALDLCFVELRKRDPGNGFYEWLRSGSTNDVIDHFLAWAPSRPLKKQADWPYEKPPGEYSNQRVHSAAVVFMANLLER